MFPSVWVFSPWDRSRPTPSGTCGVVGTGALWNGDSGTYRHSSILASTRFEAGDLCTLHHRDCLFYDNRRFQFEKGSPRHASLSLASDYRENSSAPENFVKRLAKVSWKTKIILTTFLMIFWKGSEPPDDLIPLRSSNKFSATISASLKWPFKPPLPEVAPRYVNRSMSLIFV